MKNQRKDNSLGQNFSSEQTRYSAYTNKIMIQTSILTRFVSYAKSFISQTCLIWVKMFAHRSRRRKWKYNELFNFIGSRIKDHKKDHWWIKHPLYCCHQYQTVILCRKYSFQKARFCKRL
jgi:hypothetical protein